MGKENLEVMDMFLWCVTCYKDIVHVDKNEGEFPADLIHKLLEGLCCIPESIRHHKIFIETKGVIMAVFGMSSLCTRIWLKARTSKVNLGEDCGSV